MIFALRTSSIPWELSTPVIEWTNGCNLRVKRPVPQPKSKEGIFGVKIISSDINEIKKGIDEIRRLNKKGAEKKKIAEKIEKLHDLLNQYDS